MLPDKERITNLGRVIRKLSIGELSQLINVMQADMSWIGPRPLLFKLVSLYSNAQLRRHEVKPGITGWAQVNGRNSIAWSKKFELEIEYIDSLSFSLDIKNLFLTLLKVKTSIKVRNDLCFLSTEQTESIFLFFFCYLNFI